MAMSQEQLNKLLKDDLANLMEKHQKLNNRSLVMAILLSLYGFVLTSPERIVVISSILEVMTDEHMKEIESILEKEDVK